jgi:phosphoribosyl-AMP cyclohydrolase / phosphoribosyl-ATP pyrophosphohydrolase
MTTPHPDTLDFDKGNGLLTVVAQDAVSGAVLMVAHMDREAFDKTVETGEMHYRSRTRGLWHKGATSGNTQRLVSLTPDCDGDALLARVIPAGPACHTGAESCFGELLSVGDTFSELAHTIEARATATDSSTSYTQKLLGDRNLRLKKLGEETAELVTALADGDTERASEEAADVLYHTLVALRAIDVRLGDVRDVLARRGTKTATMKRTAAK